MGIGKSQPIPRHSRSPYLGGNELKRNSRHIGYSYTIVWCDSQIGDEGGAEDDSHTLSRLRRVIGSRRQLIHGFHDVEECREFLKELDNVLLIVSGRDGKTLVPEIHNAENIFKIFIFCMNDAAYRSWSKHYAKVHGVYTNINDICQIFNQYFSALQPIEFDKFQCSFLQPITDGAPMDDDRRMFIYSICSQMILSKVKLPKELMIELCNQEYPYDYVANLMTKFESSYSSQDAIVWFTKDRLYQELVNHALRSNDLYSLFALNFFIRDINSQLTLLYQQSPRLVEPLVLYFNQTISCEEFEKFRNKSDLLICVNEFLFANSERGLAYRFLEDQAVRRPKDCVNVLFKILVPTSNTPNAHYANIGNASRFALEREYLFAMGSIFRIENVDRLEEYESAWMVHLTLVDKEDPQLLPFNHFIRKNYLRDDTDFERLTSMLKSRLYQFRINRHFFDTHFNWNLKQIRTILVRLHLGMILDCVGQYDEALSYYTSILKFIVENTQKDSAEKQIFLAPFYSMMSQTSQQKGLDAVAFKQGYKSFEILTKSAQQSLLIDDIAAVCNCNFASILEQQGKNPEAVNHYRAALIIRSRYLPENHRELVDLKNNIDRLSMQDVMNPMQGSGTAKQTTVL